MCSENEVDIFIQDLGLPFRQINGQRILGPATGLPEPGAGCEVCLKSVPSDFFEDQLYPMCSEYGQIYLMRLMVNFSGETRGLAYIKYTSVEEADNAINHLDRKEIKQGFIIKAEKSIDNLRLYFGGIPVNITEDEFLERIKLMVDGIENVNFGPTKFSATQGLCKFAFVEFATHREAAIARRFFSGSCEIWDRNIRVDWAKPQSFLNLQGERDYRKLFIRNFPLDLTVRYIATLILSYIRSDFIERIYVNSGYGFIHLSTFTAADFLLQKLTGLTIGGLQLHVEWARIPTPENDEIIISNYRSVPNNVRRERFRRQNICNGR